MPTHFDAVIKDLLVSEAIASETTSSAFMSGASVKEIQIFAEDGQTVPTAQGKFFFMSKKADGSPVTSDVIDGTKILSVVKTSPVTSVPEYSYFTVSNSNVATGDIASVSIKYLGEVTQSVMDWQYKNATYTVKSTDTTALLITVGLAKQLCRNLSETYYYNNRPQSVMFLSGYDKVYTTEAACIADKSALTNGRLIWIISNGKAYTVADKTASTFATIATEKTDWSTELGNGTAVKVNEPKFQSVIFTSASVLYIINKPIDRVVDKFAGEASKLYVGAMVTDPDAVEEPVEWTVTRVGETWNPTSGKKLANLEAHLDKLTRQYGSYNYKEFKFTPTIVDATDYYTLTINYLAADRSRLLTGNPQKSTIIVACDASADADTLLGLINIAKDGPALTLADLPAISVGDLADVLLTSPAENEILKLNGDDVWVNAADETGA